MTGDYDAPMAPQAQRARHDRWRRLPTLLCALASVLSSLALSACGNSVPPPPGLCGEAPSSLTRAPLGIRPPPLAADGIVYVGYSVPGTDPSLSQTTTIAALRQRDGALLWSVPDSNDTDQLAVADGVLILLGRGIVGLRARDGASLWAALPWHSYGVLPWVIGGGILYVIHDALYAFRITDGHLLWQTPVQDDLALSPPVLDGATVYVGSSGGFLMALRADTGALLWKIFPPDLTSPTPTTSATPLPQPAQTYTPLGVVAVHLYVWVTGIRTNGLLHVDPTDGASAAYTLPLPAATPLHDPLIINGTLYVEVEDTPTSVAEGRPDIVAYRLLASSGRFLWRFAAHGSSLSVIARDAQTLYLQDWTLGDIYAVRLADGAVLWRQRLPPLAGPVAADADTGEVFEAVPGVDDFCDHSGSRVPRISAFKRADGGIIWTRALDF